jgi:hypothetical protein
MGSQEPSVRIAPEYLTSDGLDAIKVLNLGGFHPDPWQSDLLDDWLAIAPSGKWACRTCGGSVPRQNGKTCILEARAEAGMILTTSRLFTRRTYRKRQRRHSKKWQFSLILRRYGLM